jgi:hypothetical protein
MVGLLLSMLRDLARELDVTIVVIHHPRKPSGDARLTALQAARGSGDLTASVDSYLYFRKLAGGVEHEHVKRTTAERLPELREAEPNITQPEAAKALGVSERTVREHWHEEPPASLLDEEEPS